MLALIYVLWAHHPCSFSLRLNVIAVLTPDSRCTLILDLVHTSGRFYQASRIVNHELYEGLQTVRMHPIVRSLPLLIVRTLKRYPVAINHCL